MSIMVYRRLISLCAVVGVMGLAAPALAVSLAQAYNGTTSLVPGELVSIEAAHSQTVEAATPANQARLTGVVVSAPLTTAVLTSGSAVTVARAGNTTAYASDLNGTPQTGDKLAVSPIAGVGMKAVTPVPIVGTVTSGFLAGTVTQRQITRDNGTKQSVRVGLVDLTIGIATYIPPGAVAQSFIPVPVQNIVYGLTGHSIAGWRILLAALVMILGALFLIIVVYTTLRHSLLAIGRNPLASSPIIGALTRVAVVTVSLIFLILVTVYILLIA